MIAQRQHAFDQRTGRAGVGLSELTQSGDLQGMPLDYDNLFFKEDGTPIRNRSTPWCCGSGRYTG